MGISRPSCHIFSTKLPSVFASSFFPRNHRYTSIAMEQRGKIFKVPSHLARYLIGIENETVNQLETYSGATIHVEEATEVTNPTCHYRQVFVSGTRANIDEAESLIVKILHMLERHPSGHISLYNSPFPSYVKDLDIRKFPSPGPHYKINENSPNGIIEYAPPTAPQSPPVNQTIPLLPSR